MVSVRAAVEPLNTAVGQPPTIFLVGSFAGLPLINQALAAEHPLGGGAFFVTLRSLIKVLGEIPIADVLHAIQVAHAPHPPPPPPPTPHPPPAPQINVTCGVELDLDQPGSGGVTGMRVFGGGFVFPEMVDIIQQGEVAASGPVDTMGGYSIHMSVLDSTPPSLRSVHAHGQSSGRTSNEAGFMV